MLLLRCPNCGTKQAVKALPADPRYCWDCLCSGKGWVQVVAVREKEALPPQFAANVRKKVTPR